MNEKKDLVEEFYKQLVTSISDIELPSYLKDFKQFNQLSTTFLIKNLYFDIVIKTSQATILQNVNLLILQLITSRKQRIAGNTYGYLSCLHKKLPELLGKTAPPVTDFIHEVVTLLDSDLLEEIPSDVTVKEIKKLSQIVQKAIELYCQNADSDELKTYLNNSVCKALLDRMHKLHPIVIKRPQSKDYSSHINLMLDSLKKILEVKDVKMLFGEVFLDAIQKEHEYILSIQQIDRFLARDFSNNPVGKKRIKETLNWLDIHSKMDIHFLELRMNDVVKYHYQVNSILAHTSDEAFKKDVLVYYTSFKKKLEAYAQNTKLENHILLTVFGVILSGIDIYDKYDQNIKLSLQIKIKEIYEKSKTDVYACLCFLIEILNYTPFFQEETVDLKIQEIKRLSEKLISIQTKNDSHTKYLIEEVMEKFLEYFVKNIILSAPSIDLNDEQSIEKLASLLKEDAQVNKELLYLNELKKFCDAFVATIWCVPSNLCPNKTVTNFVESLEHQKNAIELALQNKLNLFVEEKVSVIASHLKSADQQLDVLEKTLEEDRERQLNPLIAQTIPVITTYFRLNAIGHSETVAIDYVKQYCYRSKLKALCDALIEHFPKKDLSSPKTWATILKTVLSKKAAFDHQALIFIVGVSYEDKKEYTIAKKFYDYCLKYSFFDNPSKTKEGMYLIDKKLIEKHIKVCKEKLNSNVSKPIDYSPSAIVIPSVLQDTSVSVKQISEIDSKVLLGETAYLNTTKSNNF